MWFYQRTLLNFQGRINNNGIQYLPENKKRGETFSTYFIKTACSNTKSGKDSTKPTSQPNKKTTKAPTDQ